MEQASVLLDFFVQSTIRFWSESAFDAEKPIDAIGRTKQKILSVLREKFNGETKRKTLRDYSNAGNQLFEKALAELVENRKVRIEEREIRGQKTVFVTLSSKFTSPFYFTLENKHDRNTSETTKGEKTPQKGEVTPTSPLLHPTSPFEINTTETQVKQQKAQKGEVKKGEVNAFSEPTSPEPTTPQTVPESQPLPVPMQPTAKDDIPKNSKNGYDSMTVMTVCENNETETTPKQQNASYCHKSHCHNPYDSVNDVASPEPTVRLSSD